MSDSPPLSIFFVIFVFEMQSSLLLSKNGTILEKYTRGQYTRVNKKENEMKCAIINDYDDDEAQFLFTLSSTERRNTIAKYKYSYSLHATLDKVSIPSPRFFRFPRSLFISLSAQLFQKENKYRAGVWWLRDFDSWIDSIQGVVSASLSSDSFHTRGEEGGGEKNSIFE